MSLAHCEGSTLLQQVYFPCRNARQFSMENDT